MITERDIKIEELNRQLARLSYADYLAYTGGKLWIDTRLSKYLAEQVQAFIETDTGNPYDVLIFECPPQHGKTMSITEALPSWYLGKYPDKRVIMASYDTSFAEAFCRRNRDKIAEYGANLFGVSIGSINRAGEFNLAGRRGRLISRGIMSGITGNPADLMVIDDPIKNREEADSQTYRDKLWGEWSNTLKSRLSAGAKVIVILTPWHEDDFAARLTASEPHVKVIRIPIEAEDNDPLGRQPGEALCPEIGKGNEWLQAFKASYISDPKAGKRAWEALYMCRPRIEGGNLIRRDWWKFYDPSAITQFATELISVDATFKKTDDSDFVAITVWGKLGGDYYLRYCLNKRMDFPETVKAIRTVRLLYPAALAVLIEDKANGSAIISTLQQEMFCIPVNPKGGKEARVAAISPAIESGHVFLPDNAPWTEDVIDQFAAFPAGKHDDICDSASQALTYMLFSSGYIDTRTLDEQEIDCAEDDALEIFTTDDLYNVYG
jgi:predicted phage terminase large subunit-like protein